MKVWHKYSTDSEKKERVSSSCSWASILKLKVCFGHKIQLQFDWKLCLQLAKLGFSHEVQFPNYIFSCNLNEHYAFCLHLQSRNSFSVQFESLFSYGKQWLGFSSPPQKKTIMHLGVEEMWSEFAIWACFYTLGEAEALG